jgi:hypothetical protein
MRYRLTPLNFFSFLLIGIEIVVLAFPESLSGEPHGYQHIFLIPVILAGLAIDLVLQKTIRSNTWLLIIEVVLIALTILLNIKL